MYPFLITQTQGDYASAFAPFPTGSELYIYTYIDIDIDIY